MEYYVGLDVSWSNINQCGRSGRVSRARGRGRFRSVKGARGGTPPAIMVQCGLTLSGGRSDHL